jgi:glutaredoxin
MNLKFLLLLFILSPVFGVSFADFTQVQNSQSNLKTVNTADIEIFVRDNCQHCIAAKRFLNVLQQEKPDLRIVIHNVIQEPGSVERLEELTHTETFKVPTIYVRGQLIIGYFDDQTTGKKIRQALENIPTQSNRLGSDDQSCEISTTSSCEASNHWPIKNNVEKDELFFWGKRITVAEIGLPIFTLAMGAIDGFNPCSMWVLILMISLLAPMKNRWRMLILAGTFITIEGIVYFLFMTAWLNLFLTVGISQALKIFISLIALIAGTINLKDFWFLGRGTSLSISNTAKIKIYKAIRCILNAQNFIGALMGIIILGVTVQLVEFMCTSGIPLLYTQILTSYQLDSLSYYGYLLLYNFAYMLDDFVILGIGIVTLSHHRLQEKEGRWLKLISGMTMIGLSIYLLISL